MTEPAAVSIRDARPEELADLAGILDAAMLQTDASLQKRVSEGSVLVAVRDTAESPVLGTLVLIDDEITAIAVRPGRRGRGIGRRLVEAAVSRGPVHAEFDPRVRGFYDSLGFEIERLDDSERLRGSLEGCPDGTLAGVE